MELEELDAFGDELVFIVLGPGFGESILIRWPPSDWLVVDCFRQHRGGSERPFVAEVLEGLHAAPSAIALTHPHQDHAAGFAGLIDRRAPGAPVGFLAEPDLNVWWASPDPRYVAELGLTEQALAAIQDVWDNDPTARWNLRVESEPVVLGDCVVEVLSPSQAEVQAVLSSGVKVKPNPLSSALLVTWRDCQVLLGADLTRAGWHHVERRRGVEQFAETSAIKVAHHGSAEAQHSVALGSPPARDRFAVAAPFNKGGKVPDFAPGQDVDQLLQVVQRLYLTTHHSALPVDCGSAELAAAQIPTPKRSLGSLIISLDDAVERDVAACWVTARFSPDGSLREMKRGAQSMCVVS